jgi:rfaE bifunctional protein kinase chain/domain
VVNFTEQRLKELYSAIAGKHIAVVGDLMLDRYLWGTVTRISPEAPVPIVEVDYETSRLGGAANVANNIKSLGGIPILIGVAGNDPAAGILKSIMEENGFPTEGVITDERRPTTMKTRVIAHNQHVVRIDQEVKHDLSPFLQQQVLAHLRSQIYSIDALIIEDYNKGVIAKDLIAPLIQLANDYRKIITVDPKFHNFLEYKNVTVFKPNRKEVEEALGMKFLNEKIVEEAGKILLEKLNARYVLLTRGEKGMSLFDRDGNTTHVPTKALEVADVSGAGDTVISTLTMVLAGGGSMKEAASLANYAGGVVCGEIGIVPITLEALTHAVLSDNDPMNTGA